MRAWRVGRIWISISRDALLLRRSSGLRQYQPGAGDTPIGSLLAKKSDRAHPASLSAAYGLDPFPLHTDGAHLVDPPEFILMEALKVEPGDHTLLLRINEADISNEMRHGLFAVRSGALTRLQPAYDHRGFIRFDPGCMAPRDGLASEVCRYFQAVRGNARSHIWSSKPGSTLVIDNRQTLHGRPEVASCRAPRLLRRLMLRRTT